MPEFTGEVHPVADLFPMLPDDELAGLAEDIVARGLLQPIVLDGEGRLLDGRNRLAACKKAGVEPTFTVYDGGDPDGYALTVNTRRRQLTPGQRNLMGGKLAKALSLSTREAAQRCNLHQRRVVEAQGVLRYPDLAEAIDLNTMPWSQAVAEAAERDEANALRQAKLDRLAVDASDLSALVEEERMGVDDAIAALDARVTKTEQEAAERERKRAEEARDSLALLTRIVDLAAPNGNGADWADAWAARLERVDMDLVSRTEQAGNLLLQLAERLRP